MFVKGGFLSHIAGKLFVRTGGRASGRKISFRIHNVFEGDEMNPGEHEWPDVSVAHCHAKTWEDWQALLPFRREKGSYRAELPPASTDAGGKINLHALFQSIEDAQGPAGLRLFYDEVVADTPELRARLEQHGLLRRINLDLDATLARHFPSQG